jgi:hypothetical protein
MNAPGLDFFEHTNDENNEDSEVDYTPEEQNLLWDELFEISSPLSSPQLSPSFVADVAAVEPTCLHDPPDPESIATSCQLVTLSSEETCSVCLDGMTGGRMLPCKHVFHEMCVRRWFENSHSCPFCRSIV